MKLECLYCFRTFEDIPLFNRHLGNHSKGLKDIEKTIGDNLSEMTNTWRYIWSMDK